MRDPNKNVSRRPGSVHSGGNIIGSSIVILSLNSNAVSLISLVKELIKQFTDLFSIEYKHNKVALKTATNGKEKETSIKIPKSFVLK